MASTWRANAIRTASRTASPAIRPAATGSEGTALRSPLPISVRSASSGPKASAFSITSGPIPRGSPTVTARRGRRLEPDVDVRGAAQEVEVVLDGELLPQTITDAILHVVEGQLPLGDPLGQLEHDEPWSRAAAADFEHGLQPRDRVPPDRLVVLGWQLRDGQRVGELRLIGIGVAARERIERRPVGQGVVHRIREPL